jgi:hypothetical protein
MVILMCFLSMIVLFDCVYLLNTLEIHWYRQYEHKDNYLCICIIRLTQLIKIKIPARQANNIRHYKNLRMKLLNCCASIHLKQKNKKKTVPVQTAYSILSKSHLNMFLSVIDGLFLVTN